MHLRWWRAIVAGRIIKAVGGFYTVLADGRIISCKARGVFKKRGIKPLVGDLVEVELSQGDEGVVTDVRSRVNHLIRPAIANVDQVLLVSALVQPTFSSFQFDKTLAMIESAGLPAALCFTKIDLPGALDVFESVSRVYSGIGYPVLGLNVRQGRGLPELRATLAAKITVLAGLSGVGKSTILRYLIPDTNAVTGSVSQKGHRGRQTTTHVELFPFGTGFVADTPGFSQFDLAGVEVNDLASCFIEFRSYESKCEYRGCLHDKDAGCSVVKGVLDGEIVKSRYDSYLQLLAELQEAKARRY